MLRLTISDRQESELNAIVLAGPDRLADVLGKLDDVQSALSSPKALREKFEQWLGEDIGSSLLKQLFALTSFGRAAGVDVRETLEGVRPGLAARNWSTERMAAWDRVAPNLLALLQHSRVQVSAKALELAFNFSKIFSTAEILVDLRPVFDTDHDAIVGMLVSHKLRLHLVTDAGSESHSIAMDETDIKRLHKSCSEALKKAEKAKAFIGKSCDIETFIVGDDFYE